MRGRSWTRPAVGGLVIVGVYAVLWMEFGPRPSGSPDERPGHVHLVDATAVVTVLSSSRTRHASIACDGVGRRASGFWAADPATACDALASARGALLSGPGCPRIGRHRVGITATGSFGGRDFAHRAVRGGCPDPDGWLAVNVLGLPVLSPDRELDGRTPDGG
jgi:hypothetical protein